MVNQQEKVILDAVDSWKILALDRYLSQDIGSRMSGTEGDRKAIEWVSGHFTSLGLKTELDHFNTLSWDYRGVTFRVGAPFDTSPASRAAYYSYRLAVGRTPFYGTPFLNELRIYP
ncbi:MAG: hypothetical protein LWX01_12855 [Deltaproteobacteria bacterium]|nr:hypothetical protein [Deltaproteobacteria bacterium]